MLKTAIFVGVFRVVGPDLASLPSERELLSFFFLAVTPEDDAILLGGGGGERSRPGP